MLPTQLTRRLPLLILALLFLITAWLLLNRSAAQARDTARKHHLDDIEQSLYAAFQQRDTFPPYDQPSWCGRLNHPNNAAVKSEVEAALRAHNDQYGQLAKPFPQDPLIAGVQGGGLPREVLPVTGRSGDYFYWKHSPAVFELYAMLEAAPTGERNTTQCPSDPKLIYDYGIRSYDRQPY